MLLLEWGKEECAVCCAKNDKNSLAWFKNGRWILRRMIREFQKGICPL
jgi:hypothetical protein